MPVERPAHRADRPERGRGADRSVVDPFRIGAEEHRADSAFIEGHQRIQGVLAGCSERAYYSPVQRPRTGEDADMRAVQVVEYGTPVRLAQVPEPRLDGPHDVLVRIAGAGICRTDLHIAQGELAAAFHPELPYTLGHENAGWVHEVGSAVTTVRPGDPVLVHPAVTCGLCVACRSGQDMHCPTWRFPGVDGWHGGYAELLRTTVRSLVPLAPGTDPASLAPHADAG